MIKSKILYFFELSILIPFLPLLKKSGNRIRKKINKLPPQSEYLQIIYNPNHENLLIIGESTAAGVGASNPDRTFAANISRFLQDKLNVYNIGRNGLKASQLNNLLLSKGKDLPKNFKIAIVLIGANDCFQMTSPTEFHEAIKTFVAFLIEKKGIQSIILPIIPPVHQFPSIKGLLRIFLKTHRRLLTIVLLDIAKLYPQVRFEDYLQELTADFFASDGIHPSDEGYLILAEKTIAELDKA